MGGSNSAAHYDASVPRLSKPEGTSHDAWDLYCAAAEGHLPTIRRLIDMDPELMHYQIRYEFPLHFAVREGHVEAVRLLLEAGTNPARSNYTYSSWQKLLPMARERDDVEMHKLLVSEMKFRFNYDPEFQPLWTAIQNLQVDVVRGLLDEYPQRVYSADHHGNRPLHWAVLSRHLPAIELLLDAGAVIDTARADGQTPLQLSVEGDYWYRRIGMVDSTTDPAEVTDLLLKHGATKLVDVAAAQGDCEFVEQLLADCLGDWNIIGPLSSARRSPLYLAAAHGQFEMVRLLLESGVDPNTPEHCADNGRALFAACARSDVAMVELLLDHGADPDAEVDSCGNCLSIAEHRATQETPKIVALLRRHGAHDGLWLDVSARELRKRLIHDNTLTVADGMWPGVLQVVLAKDDVELLNQFVTRFGADTIRTTTPANGANLPKSSTVLDELIRHGLNVNRPDWYGQTFLHCAATDASPERAQWLLDRGTAIDTVDHLHGTTALGVAAAAGNRAMVAFLLASGADPSLPTNRNWAQPLKLAVRNGHDDIAAVLTKH